MKSNPLERFKMKPHEKIIVIISLICLAVLLVYRLVEVKPRKVIRVGYSVSSAASVSADSNGAGSASVASGTGEAVSSAASIGGLININTATAEELTALDGIGQKRAEAIVAYRSENGAFAAVEDIKNVSGIGDATFEKIKDSITVG